MKKFISIVFLLIITSSPLFAFENYWTDVTGSQINSPGERRIIPNIYRTFELNLASVTSDLQYAPKEKYTKVQNSTFELAAPMPDGSIQRFRIVEYAMMEEGLSGKYPVLKTYYGIGVDNRSISIRFDVTYAGFHAMMFTPNGLAMIDPYTTGTTTYYSVYYRKDYPTNTGGFTCGFVNDEHAFDNNNNHGNNYFLQGEQLRTYRLALACTGEYAAVFGSTVPGVLSEMTTCMNRVNGVYEKDVAARMVIIANNNLLIYLDPNTDPYTNNNGSTMLGQNQTTCDNVIGPSNYDIGHVFSTGGGGIAGLGVICRAGQKAYGVTGLPSPIGDPFYIDYVAHEMGHQFGGNHTFNSVSGSCGGGNRAASAAYEPGSASTIMGYAGICGGDDLQPHSDPYFHYYSIQEIRNYISVGQGNGCAVITSTGNNDPNSVTVPPGGFTIPKSTPFSLTGSATDPNNDTLYYCWEESDLGPAGTWNNPSGNAPIFRSFNPITTGFRTFPKLSDLLNNTTTVGEILPTYARNLSFKLTARDNRPGGGGVLSNSILFSVDVNSGPFLVTFPNTNVTLYGSQTVTWDVANTTAAPVSCSNVDILLSIDSGKTYPTVLAANTPNDGSQQVTLPAINNTGARIKVQSVGNIFFDISNTNFTITNVNGISGNQNSAPIIFALDQNYPNPFNPSTFIGYSIPEKSAVTLKIYDVTGRLVSTLLNNEIKTEGSYKIEFYASDLPSGIYLYRIDAGKFSASKKLVLIK